MTRDPEVLSLAIAREVERAIGRYDFSASTRVSLLSESENKVFLVEDPECRDKYVVRVNSGRLHYHTPASITSELTWIMALEQDTDITVPHVLHARDGALVQTLSAPDLDQDRYAAVYSFLPGIEPPEDQLSEGFAVLGEISARMHQHARSWVPPDHFSRHSWTPAKMLGNHYNWGHWRQGVNLHGDALSLLSRLEDVLKRRLSRLPTDERNFGLIHADLRLANLLVDNRKTAVIDFDDCGLGWYLFDLAAALSFLEARSDVPELIARWLEGYRRITDVSAEIAAELPSLIMLNRVVLLGWVGYQFHRIEFAREIGADFTADTLRLTEDYLSRFD